MKCLLKNCLFLAVGAALLFLATVPASSEELYNLQILFRKTYDERDDNLYAFGEDIRGVGDINGDGYDDIAAIGWEPLNPLGWRCIVFVFFGGAVMDTLPDVILRDNYWGGSTWATIAGGDVNSDGFSDVIAGLPYGPGNVDIYFGGNPMDTIPDLCLFEEPPEWFFGCAVATGDVDGDGHCDVVAADYDKDNKGAVYVFYGGPMLDHIPDITLGAHGQEGFGITVGSGGDVNSDGYDDVVVGAWANSETYLWAGRIYVYYGGSPMDTLFDVSMSGEGPQQHLGWKGVDVCQDVYTHDFVVTGTAFWPNGFPADSPGRIYVLFGGDPMDGVPDLLMHGKAFNSALGTHVRNAGDIDGDGSDDLIAGAPHEEPWGIAYLWLSGSNMDTIPDASFRGDSMHTLVAFRVASAGDVDGDGRDEVMVSNYSAFSYWHTVWVCKYTGMGVSEEHASASSYFRQKRILCTPNPFSSRARIRLVGCDDLSGFSELKVSLEVHDAAGRIVRKLYITDGDIMWDGTDLTGRDVPSGTYFVQLSSREPLRPAKLVLVR